MEHVVPTPEVKNTIGKLRRELSTIHCCGCLAWLWTGPSYNSRQESAKKQGQKTVVCVAGLASSALERKKPKSLIRRERYEVSYCSIDALALNAPGVLGSLKLRLVDGTLKDGTKVKSTASLEGIEMRPVEGTAGIRTLNPGEVVPVSVWDHFIDDNTGVYNCHAFNYDWRRWGDLAFAEEVVEGFQRKVEASIASDRHPCKRATVVGHSMGASVILYCLSVLGDRWTEEHIDHVVFVAPGFTGSPSMMPSFAHAPFLATAAWLPAHLGEHSLGDMAATWACMLAEMPTPVGRVQPWPADYVFASTPERQYGLADIGQFLEDAAACTSGREFGPALWPGVQRMNAAMRAPAAHTCIIYSSGHDTPAQFRYQRQGELGAAASISGTEPGDGTITSGSVVAVARAWRAEGRRVDLVECPGAVDHKALINSDFTIAVVGKITGGEELTPLAVEVVGAAGVRNADLFSLSDPYCALEIGGKRGSKRRTKTRWNTLSPVWDERFTLYSYSDGDSLTLRVYDDDTLKASDLLGVATLTAPQLRAGFRGTLPLSPGPGHLEVRASVCRHDVGF